MSGNVGSKPTGSVFKFLGAYSKQESSSKHAAVSVKKGLRQIGMASETPENTEVASKRDAQLRATVTVMTAEDTALKGAEDAALKGSGKSEKLVGLVGQAMTTADPTATMASSFSKYLVGSDAKVGERVGKLSQAVYDYANSNPNTPKTNFLEDVLRKTLVPIIDELSGKAPGFGAKPADMSDFIKKHAAVLLLNNTLANPYLFDSDRSGGSRDMIASVKETNDLVSNTSVTSAELVNHKTRIMANVKSSIEFPDGTCAVTAKQTLDMYTRFEQIDLGIDPQSGAQNAYEILGLRPDCNEETLQTKLEEMRNNGYMRAPESPGAASSGLDSRIRNAAFQLQTPAGKASYDLYLGAKGTDENPFYDTVVNQADASKVGMIQDELRFQVLAYCLSKAMPSKK